jgi:undecaprenyl-diphosphatase
MGKSKELLRTASDLAHFRKILITGSLLVLLLVVLFSYITHVILTTESLVFDMVVIDGVQSVISDGLTPVMLTITEFGDKYVLITLMLIALLILVFIKRHYWEAIMLIVSLAGGDLIKHLLKNLIGRERPTINPLIIENEFSFPSGHSIASVTFYGMIAYIIWSNLPQRKGLRIVTLLAAVLLVLSIGISRIYLGVHYPTDVVGGYTIGGAWLLVSILALRSIRRYKRNHKAIGADSRSKFGS